MSINNQPSPNFGIRISERTVRRANQACIDHAKAARSQGLTLAQYNELHRGDHVHTVGNRTYDFYAIAKGIVENKEKLNEAYGNALRRVRWRMSKPQ